MCSHGLAIGACGAASKVLNVKIRHNFSVEALGVEIRRGKVALERVDPYSLRYTVD